MKDIFMYVGSPWFWPFQATNLNILRISSLGHRLPGECATEDIAPQIRDIAAKLAVRSIDLDIFYLAATILNLNAAKSSMRMTTTNKITPLVWDRSLNLIKIILFTSSYNIDLQISRFNVVLSFKTLKVLTDVLKLFKIIKINKFVFNISCNKSSL